MIILGLHFGHDASISILQDGYPIALVHKERRLRIKHAIGLDFDDVTHACDRAGIRLAQIDFCTVTSTQNIEYLFFNPTQLSFVLGGKLAGVIPSPFYEKVASRNLDTWQHQGASRLRFNRTEHSDHFYNTLFRQYKDVDINTLPAVSPIEDFVMLDMWQQARRLDEIATLPWPEFDPLELARSMHVPISVSLDGCDIPGALFSHHFAHAAYAFYQSGFDRAAILTHDGGLDSRGYRAGLYCYGEGSILYPLAPHYLHLGWMYHTVAARLGLGDIGGSGKLMGLAAYGEPTFFDPERTGNWYDDTGWESEKHHQEWFDAVFDAVVEQARTNSYDISALANQDRITERINADIAASCQKHFEVSFLKAVDVLAEIVEKEGKDGNNLCLSGGAVLNCPANTLVANRSRFSQVFIPPACDDGGLALGSAYLLYHAVLGYPRYPTGLAPAEIVYLGVPQKHNALPEAIAKCGDTLQVEYPTDAALCGAEILANNGIIGWFEGRSEVGPRALGHRSILANPSELKTWERVNKIKFRELWRPLAPVVLEAEADRWFESIPLPSPYMLFAACVRDRDKLAAVTHVDGSARVQTVSEGSGEFYRVLYEFARLSGIPVLLNTSFNGPGEPIVECPTDALNFLLRSSLDAIFIDGVLVRRCI